MISLWKLIEDDHRALERATEDLGRGPLDTYGERARALETLRVAWDWHSRDMRELIYPILERRQEPPSKEVALHQDAAVDTALKDILDQTGNAAVFREKIIPLSDALHRHIAFAEKEMLPKVQRTIDGHELVRIAAVWGEAQLHGRTAASATQAIHSPQNQLGTHYGIPAEEAPSS